MRTVPAMLALGLALGLTQCAGPADLGLRRQVGQLKRQLELQPPQGPRQEPREHREAPLHAQGLERGPWREDHGVGRCLRVGHHGRQDTRRDQWARSVFWLSEWGTHR